MNWWKRMFGRAKSKVVNTPAPNIEISGWHAIEQAELSAAWRDADGDVLSLNLVEGDFGLPSLSDVNGLRRYCRKLAEDSESGLVEVAVIAGVNGPGLTLIYKRLKGSGFVFTGMLMIPMERTSWLWTMVALERGITGVREAVVTAQLMNEGKLTLESYEASWAQDPYDPAYKGVDRSRLRYMSDDQIYDSQFPQHPLSKVRHVQRKLLNIPLRKTDLGGAVEKLDES